MSIKHAFAYQKSRFSFRKNWYTSDKKPLSPKANSFDKHWFKKKKKKKKTYGIAFVLKLHILIFFFYFIFFYFYDAITEPYTGSVDPNLHNFNSNGNILNHMAILPEPLLSSHLS